MPPLTGKSVLSYINRARSKPAFLTPSANERANVLVVNATRLSVWHGLDIHGRHVLWKFAKHNKSFTFSDSGTGSVASPWPKLAIFTNREPANGPIRTFSLHVHLRPPRTSTERL